MQPPDMGKPPRRGALGGSPKDMLPGASAFRNSFWTALRQALKLAAHVAALAFL